MRKTKSDKNESSGRLLARNEVTISRFNAAAMFSEGTRGERCCP